MVKIKFKIGKDLPGNATMIIRGEHVAGPAPTVPPPKKKKKKRTRPILALDLARLTGFAFWNGKRLKWSGTIELTPVSPPGPICLALRTWLRELSVWKKKNLAVMYEMPVAYGNRRGVGRGFQLEAILITECEALEIPYYSLPQPTLKKHATGNGRAKKPEMIAAAAKRWKLKPKDDNEADALCILGWAIDRERLFA